MNYEKQFLSERFAIVCAELEDPNVDMEREDRIRLQRERRLLGKLLAEVPEGKALAALKQWRAVFGKKLAEHRRRTVARQKAYDEWCQLPNDMKRKTPKPNPPSLGTRVNDRNGYTWVVDDRFLAMVDDLIERLGKWLADPD